MFTHTKTFTMKPITSLILLVVGMASFSGCNSSDSIESKINGRWELRHVTGIQVANVDPNFPKGNGNILKFDNGQLERFTANKLMGTDTYTIKEEKKKINNSEAQYTLIFKDKSEKHIGFSEGKLILFDGEIAADGTESIYEKL